MDIGKAVALMQEYGGVAGEYDVGTGRGMVSVLIRRGNLCKQLAYGHIEVEAMEEWALRMALEAGLREVEMAARRPISAESFFWY